MAWVEIELDERTFRTLQSRAEREGISVADVLRRMAAREAGRREEPKAYLPIDSLSGERGEAEAAIRAAGPREF